MEVASEYVEQRESFNIKLADRESDKWSRRTAYNMEQALDNNEGMAISKWWCGKEVSMAKNHVAVLHRAVDTALQLNGTGTQDALSGYIDMQGRLDWLMGLLKCTRWYYQEFTEMKA